jgi:hypothetical protein
MEEAQFGFSTYNSDTFASLISYFNLNFPSYKYFFYADMFFLLAVCWIVYSLYHKLTIRESFWGRWVRWIPYIFITIGVLAIAADVIENYCYLTGNFYAWSETVKNALAKLFIFGFILFVGINAEKEDYQKLWRFLRSSYISLIILALIGIGLTLLPQGATLIVHLFKSHSIPGLVSIVFSVFFVNMLAIIISHYPKYIDFRHSQDKTSVDWHMTEQYKGMGIITYQVKVADDIYMVLGRYILGILTYIAWFYFMYKAFALYGLTWFAPFPATVLCGGLYIIIAIYFYFKFLKVRDDFYTKKDKGRLSNDDLIPIRNWAKAYIIWLLFTFIFGFICLFIYYHYGWHTISYTVSLFFIICNATCFLLFRFMRGLMMYARSDLNNMVKLKVKDYKSEGSIKRMKESFRDTTAWTFIFKGWFWNFFTDFSSNYIFLRRLQIAGFVALVFLIITNVYLAFGDVTIFSSIPIFLAFLVNVYALIILYVKHMIFYNDYENENYYLHKKIKEPPCRDLTGIQVTKTGKNRFVLRLALAPFIFLLVFNIFKGVKNFYRMDFTDGADAMHIVDYCKHLVTHMEEKNITRMAKVASFGGGLKSNLWNLLVLDKLDKEMKIRNSNSSFLDQCFSFSGVSGGAVGLGNYLALDYNEREHGLNRNQAIVDIGNENILAIDMAGLFLHDPFCNGVKLFGNSRNKDRSFYAMEQYIKILSDGDEERHKMFSESSQQNVWHEMLKSRGHIPALIINTASTGPFPGVAFSLKSKGEEVFPGYILLENDTKDLRYFDAISTSNRFPIMSPSAQVENKGFFLDGGYFDNSGLLTSSYFQKYLKANSYKFDETPIITINVINSKSDYIRKFIQDLVDDNVILKSSDNISAVISGITDINKLPNVLRSAEGRYVEGEDEFRSIYLPHQISTSDIEKLLGGSVKFTPAILDSIQRNNNEIRNALNVYIDINKLPMKISTHGIVEPPLARTLSKYAVIYQQAMISHFKSTQDEIDEIVDWLGKK